MQFLNVSDSDLKKKKTLKYVSDQKRLKDMRFLKQHLLQFPETLQKLREDWYE